MIIQRPTKNGLLRAALSRVIEHRLPSGANNEQFRDSYIWEEFTTLNKEREIHLISADTAFYGDRHRKNGFAQELRVDLQGNAHLAELYPNLEGFLEAKGYATKIDYAAVVGKQLADAICRALRAEIAGTEVMASDLVFTSIRAFTTAGRSQIALTFSARAWANRTSDVQDRRRYARFVNGTALYNVTTESVSDTRIRNYLWRYVRPYEPEEIRQLEEDAPDRDR